MFSQRFFGVKIEIEREMEMENEKIGEKMGWEILGQLYILFG